MNWILVNIDDHSEKYDTPAWNHVVLLKINRGLLKLFGNKPQEFDTTILYMELVSTINKISCFLYYHASIQNYLEVIWILVKQLISNIIDKNDINPGKIINLFAWQWMSYTSQCPW